MLKSKVVFKKLERGKRYTEALMVLATAVVNKNKPQEKSKIQKIWTSDKYEKIWNEIISQNTLWFLGIFASGSCFKFLLP